jgi:SAM-dependent methyltransferase
MHYGQLKRTTLRINEPANLFVDGAAYERLMGQWSRPAGAEFLGWLNLPKGLRWLDVGCGNGAFTEVLIARVAPAEVIGIDPSEQQLAYARTRPGAKSAEFRAGDAQVLSFPDASFDVAVMALVVTFVPDPQKAVGEMARVVRPGGCVATYMWDVPGGGLPLEPIYAAMRALGLPRQYPTNVAVSRQDGMRALWEQAGLEAIETREIRITVAYSSFDDFWDSNTVPVGPVGKAVADLTPPVRDQLKTHLRERLPRDASGRISYGAYANAVKGRVPSKV